MGPGSFLTRGERRESGRAGKRPCCFFGGWSGRERKERAGKGTGRGFDERGKRARERPGKKWRGWEEREGGKKEGPAGKKWPGVAGGKKEREGGRKSG